MIPILILAMDITTDRSCSRTMDPDMALSSSSGPGGSTVPSEYDWQQHGSQASTEAMDTTLDPGLCRVTDPDMALDSCSCADVSMVQVAVPDTEISMAWFSDTDIVQGGQPDPGLLHGPQ